MYAFHCLVAYICSLDLDEGANAAVCCNALL